MLRARVYPGLPIIPGQTALTVLKVVSITALGYHIRLHYLLCLDANVESLTAKGVQVNIMCSFRFLSLTCFASYPILLLPPLLGNGTTTLSPPDCAPTLRTWTWLAGRTAAFTVFIRYDIWLGVPSTGTPASSASSYEMSVFFHHQQKLYLIGIFSMIWLSGLGG